MRLSVHVGSIFGSPPSVLVVLGPAARPHAQHDQHGHGLAGEGVGLSYATYPAVSRGKEL